MRIRSGVSQVVSLLAILCFVITACTMGRVPASATSWLRLATIALSSVAGVLGLMVFAALDNRGQTRQAWVTGFLGAVAGLPSLAYVMSLVYPAPED